MFLLLIPLAFAAIVLLVQPLSLKNFQGVYLLSGTLWLIISKTSFPELPLWKPALILLIGEAIHLLLVGTLGSKLSPASHGSFLIGMGLFPWYLGPSTSVFYIIFFFTFSFIWSTIRRLRAQRKFGVRGRTSEIKKILTEKEQVEYARSVSAIYAAPFLIAAITAVSITTF